MNGTPPALRLPSLLPTLYPHSLHQTVLPSLLWRSPVRCKPIWYRPMSGALALLLSMMLLPVVLAAADGNVTFRDIIADGSAGVTYARTPSPRLATLEAQRMQETYVFPDDVIQTPIKPHGVPGVVAFDYDGDGDLDLYVTNGPGTSNSLLANRLMETGTLFFEDVADQAGVGATDQDSSGVVAGDLDNDGDQDLYVLGTGEPNRLFENRGNGSFRDVTAASGTAGGALETNTSATLGDLDGDGLLDIVIAGASTFEHQPAIFIPFTPENVPNSVFKNLGNLRFTDASDSSGIRMQGGVLPQFAQAATLTHSIAAVDIDLDGDVDIISGDDQGVVPGRLVGGIDQGILHVFENDGTGHFVDTNEARGLNLIGGWMGLSFGDFDGDGRLDFFGSNFGSYAPQNFPLVLPFPGAYNSRWFLQQEDGRFVHPGLGSLVALPFGWGTSTADFDNDGDLDIIFQGGIDVGPLAVADNPGSLLFNDGNGVFRYDHAALAASVEHERRMVSGVATGDLNRDGFTDMISVSSFDAPAPIPLVPFPPLGGPFDASALFVPTFLPTATPGVFVPNRQIPELPDGSLSVEISSGNDNRWIAVDVIGSVGRTARGKVNRDGVGAVVRFSPHGGKSMLRPIIAGSSYASQDSLTAGFGLGSAHSGTVEVLWPGGVRNRLYGVHAGERIRFPEIPVSIDDQDLSFGRYVSRVRHALRDLRRNGTIDRAEQRRFFFSALLAFLDRDDEHDEHDG